MRTKNFLIEVGQRLMTIRSAQGITRSEMARRLGVNKSNYYRNETGIAFPRLESLIRLHVDFDISLDWLLFGIGAMHSDENQSAALNESQIKGLETELPDVKEFLDAMEQDQVLRYELLAYFYKYKKNQEARETALPHGSEATASST